MAEVLIAMKTTLAHEPRVTAPAATLVDEATLADAPTLAEAPTLVEAREVA